MRTTSLSYFAFAVSAGAASALFAQPPLEREVIASTGSEEILGSYSFEQTVGDLVVVTGTAGSYIVKQGFNHAYVIPDAIEESVLDEGFTLYPNPTRGQVMLSWKDGPPPSVDVEVRDVLGALVFADRAPKHWPYVLDLSQLAAGPYYVRALMQGGKALVERVNKVR